MHNYINYSNQEILDIFNRIDWSFSNERTTLLSHNIHPYPAKFIPQIPRSIIGIFSDENDLVWDVFGGCGTTAVEALLLRRNCISTDLNPLGALIGRAKTSYLTGTDKAQIDGVISSIEYLAKNSGLFAKKIQESERTIRVYTPGIPKIDKWFCKNAQKELAYIRSMIEAGNYSNNVQDVLKTALSRTVSIVSNQTDETRYKAVEKALNPGDTLRSFVSSLKTCYSKILEMDQYLEENCIDRDDYYIEFVTTDVAGDIVGIGKLIKNESVDFILTSPPYPNAHDYYYIHRFRLFWLGYDPRPVGKKEIGSHIRYQRSDKGFKQFEEEMSPVLENCYIALKNGHYAVFILGNAVFFGQEYDTASRIGALAEEKGFEIIGTVERPLPERKRSVMRRRINSERILILRKR